MKGGCRCGAVRYVLALDRLPPAYACHCRDCQTWSGSAFSQQLVLAEDLLAVSGPTEIYELVSPSGRVSRQRVCGTCHTRLYNTNSARPGVVIMRAGTLDESDALHVAAHIWTRRKQPWIAIPEGVPAWPENAPPDALAAALVRGWQT
ncbi:GFA family protein [Arenibaculum pallidiluteum]|uniref:GFA family protein n=1 Tax=Arenibaculum pallidiluteum TaxID=2812559 RepID=UPI001A976DBE|nr:GFA family protein [Arenibaculum pallidiluteum]